MVELTNTDKKRISGKQAKMISELGRSLGIVTPACKEAGISRETHYKWLRTNPLYANAVNELEKQKEDLIEQAFLNLVIDKNPQAVIHAVKTKLKHRGYGEEIAVTNNYTEGFKLIIEDGSKMETKSETETGV